MRFESLAEIIARRRAEAFPSPIFTLRMSQADYDAAWAVAGPAEQLDLSSGVLSGQIVIGESSDG